MSTTSIPKPSAKSFPIGAVRAANGVALAPMSGVTDIVFRRIAARLGAGVVVSEMVACAEFARADEESRLRAEGSGLPLHVVQLAGRDPAWIAEAARLAVGAGADVVDLNMGCPARKVVGGHGGSALLKDLDLATRLIAAAVAAAGAPVTVKMRLGWDADSIVAPELAARAEAEGAALVTVHGRTRAQFYEGRADWSAIRAVKERVSIPVIANGDLTEVEHAPAMLAASGADGVMVGRGAQGRAWFPGHVANYLATGGKTATPALATQRELALEHYEGLLALYGRDTGTRHARKHLGWYLDAAAQSVGRVVPPAAKAAALTAGAPEAAIAAFDRALADLEWELAA
ncbi:tRNA dihydrouridine synthase DusB [Hansschlegelia sp.]|uniref:tRNA dihydrouridine synthase DusB n=1 Tax=Hansschlegelia sp. TaxID=2041892 RepID=UPI002D1C3930|nr:tRNA dihydrouridine synthase DusB [Hansschlegelia sp.]HVI28567.1 tRNA dihydrouridine synthase DusB [Hansschlegelia sp.]